MLHQSAPVLALSGFRDIKRHSPHRSASSGIGRSFGGGGTALEMAVKPTASKSRRWVYVIGAIVVVLVILAGTKASQIMSMIKAGKSFVPPPESVTSTKVDQ